MHWRLSYVAAGILIALRLVQPAVSISNEDFPIGIGLGTDYITSAYIVESDDFVSVASVETSQAWKDFSRSLLRMQPYAKERREYTESEVNKLLTSTLISIREATTAKLDREIEVLGFTYPTYIADNGYIRNLLDTAIKVLPGVKRGTPAWPYLHSIRQAFPLNNAEILGYAPGTNIDQEDSLLLHLDYQNSLLEASITSIGTQATNLEGHFRITDFGGAGQNASPKKLEYLAVRIKALIKEELSRPFDPPVQLTDFRRIVFSGDAPASEFKKIRETVRNAVPELSDRFIETIKPRWVAAVGAARLARTFKLNPEMFQSQELILSDTPNLHDEL